MYTVFSQLNALSGFKYYIENCLGANCRAALSEILTSKKQTKQEDLRLELLRRPPQ